MPWAERELSSLENGLVHLDGLLGAAGDQISRGQVVAADERTGMVDPEHCFLLLDDHLEKLDRVVSAADGIIAARQVVTAWRACWDGRRRSFVACRFNVASRILMASSIR